ncbi:MAG TPA: hypothetical protein VIL49_15990 [Capillimicrobium sp.]
MRTASSLLAAAAALSVAPAASADVVVKPPPKRITVDECLTLALKHAPGTEGRRARVTVAVGLSVERQLTLRATDRFKRHELLCGTGTGRWLITVASGGDERTYPVRVVRA